MARKPKNPFDDAVPSADYNIDPMFGRPTGAPRPKPIDTDPHVVEKSGPKRSFRLRGMIDEHGRLVKPGKRKP